MEISLILVVTDKPDSRFMIQQLVENHLTECRAIQVESVQEGLAIAASTTIDIALIDMQLPGMGGLEMCRRLKAPESTVKFPILAILSDQTPSSIYEDCLQAGVDDWISQPIDRLELIAKIKVMLRMKKAEDRLRLANDRMAQLTDGKSPLIEGIEERFTLLFRYAPILISISEIETGRFLDVNDKFVELSGYRREEVIGRTSLEIGWITPEDRQKMVTRLREQGSVREIEFEVQTKEGRKMDCLCSCETILIQERSYVLIQAVDITHQKQKERMLQESEARLRESNQILRGILEHTHMQAVFLDPHCNFIWVNRAYAQACQHDPSFFPGKNHFDLYPHEENQAIFQRVVDTGVPFFATAKPFEFPDQPERGVTYWDWSLIPVKESSGQVSGLVFTLIEVTERIKMEEEIRLKSLVLDQIQDQVTLTDLNGVITYINQAQIVNLNRPKEEMIGRPTEIFGEDCQRGATQREIVEKTLQDGTWRGEVVNYTSDNRELIMDCRTQVVLDPKGTPIALCGIATDITQRKQMEELLRKESFRRSTLMEACHDGIAIINQEHQVVEANQRFAEMLGYTSEEILYLHTWDWESVMNEAEIRDHYADLSQIRTIFETRHRRKDGTFFDVEVSASGTRVNDEALVFTICRDITERKRIEEALRENEKRLQLAYKATNDVIWDWDIVHDAQKWNEAGTIVFGWTDIVQEPQSAGWWLERVHPDDQHRVDEGFFAVVDDPAKNHWQDEYRFRKTDATYAFVLDRGYVLRTKQGKAVRMIGAMLDITDRKRAVQALQESETKFRVIFQQAYDPIWLMDIETTQVVEFNEQACLSLGYTRDEFSRLTVSDIEVLESIQDTRRRIEKLLHSGKMNFETKHKTRTGEIRDIIISTSVITLNNRLYSLSILRDITEQKRIQEALENEYDRAEQYLELVGEILVALAPDQTVTLINRKGCELLGYSREEIIGQNWFDLAIPKHERKTMREFFNRLVTGEIEPYDRFENTILTRGGEERLIAWKNTYIYNSQRGIEGTLSSGEDITEHKQAELEREKLQAQLLQTQKLEALGTLAGGIAHDFNNILAGIMGFTELTLKELPPDQQGLHENLQMVLSSSLRAKSLVQQILAFSRKNDMEKTLFQPDLLVKEGIKLLRSTLPSTIEIRQRIHISSLTILGDPTQIHQILMNLCTNAAHAMQELGGILEVALSEKNLDASTPLLPYFTVLPGRYLCLEVKDNGPGIDPAIHDRIFDPFFTTKDKSKGTGLGLSVVLGIVKSHNGAIAMESQADRGTTFRIYLPIVEESTLPKTECQQSPQGQGEHILLVDDEEVLLKMGIRILQSLGYEVTPCLGSILALETFRIDPSKFDLVLTDQTMPKMKGIQLAEELLKIRPALPIILYTGYDERLNPERLQEAGICELLMKPFTAQELAHAVARHIIKL